MWTILEPIARTLVASTRSGIESSFLSTASTTSLSLVEVARSRRMLESNRMVRHQKQEVACECLPCRKYGQAVRLSPPVVEYRRHFE